MRPPSLFGLIGLPPAVVEGLRLLYLVTTPGAIESEIFFAALGTALGVLGVTGWLKKHLPTGLVALFGTAISLATEVLYLERTVHFVGGFELQPPG